MPFWYYNVVTETTLDSIGSIRLFQSKQGYRFSVDALILAAFVDLPRAGRIADLGAGSGIVGLLLAKKYPEARITLYELQESLAELAGKNIVLNNLEARVKVIREDLREVKRTQGNRTGSFDLIVSNPPFRRVRTGLLSIGEERALARHEISLKLPELAAAVSFLLRVRGRFYLIHHPARLSELIETLSRERIEVKRLRFVHSTVSTEAKMVLVEAVKQGRGGIKVEQPFFVYERPGVYSAEMQGIYEE
jgi:tRNA1Val (adenine37-N6)-methyltransferase